MDLIIIIMKWYEIFFFILLLLFVIFSYFENHPENVLFHLIFFLGVGEGGKVSLYVFFSHIFQSLKRVNILVLKKPMNGS